MKIAYIVPSLINQGPIIVVKTLTDYLVKNGCVVDVYYFDNLPGMQFDCRVHLIKMSEYINFEQYDIVHSHCFRPDKYVTKWKKRILHPKLITTLHQDTYRSFRYQHNALLSHVFTEYWCYLQSQFDNVISISNQLKDIYNSKIRTSIETIYNGCPTEFKEIADSSIINKLRSVKDNYKLLGTYAFITRRKGLDQVLQALVGLPDYAFAIIGEGPDITRLKKMSISLNISDRVFFFPYQKEPRNYLAYFDVYVMPSYSEGFGLSMVEAALAKRSIVCSNIPSFHEIFSKNEVVFFELGDMTSLQNSIIVAYEQKEQNGNLAYAKSYAKFTSERMAEEHLKFYKKIVLR